MSTPDDYENFLLEVMQVTSKSGSDKQAVYPLLEANLDKLDDNFIVLLQHWATNTLSNAEENEAESIAKSIFDFSYCIQQYPHGSKAVNQDVAIAGYEIALSVYTRDAFPLDWARTQNNLGFAYWNRIKGERAENLETAIAAYNQVLEIYTRDAFPLDWARTQSNLGLAYWNRIKGERAENLETA
ncbi:tetratricopeptide repeat protein, partial [uncultured Nostoc sp.]|uniref:tetratricopeptide repeat protein n=1 Tax=uncultured Nostoc sp. TaxID=340711 RepID=UPI0035CA91A4